MTIHVCNNQKSFNLPNYINIPYFLYQDNRLEKAATLIASFFYSLHTAGQNINASTDYLCSLVNVHKRQIYKIMNLLEQCGYIKRSGFTNRKRIIWTHCPKSKIIIEELDTNALQDTSDKELNTNALKSETNLNTSALQDTKLVHSRTLNLCTPGHTYNKDNTKDNNSTVDGSKDDKILCNNKNHSSSSFFSQNQQQQILSYKLKSDLRLEDEFLYHCQRHIEIQENDFSKFQRFTGLLKILVKNFETGKLFIAKDLKTTSNIEKNVEEVTKNNVQNSFTNEEIELVGKYNHAKKMEKRGMKFEIYMPKQQDVIKAEQIIEKIKSLEKNECHQSLQKNNARKNSLTLASSLVSHLPLSQHAS